MVVRFGANYLSFANTQDEHAGLMVLRGAQAFSSLRPHITIDNQ